LSIPMPFWGYRTIGKNWVHALEQSTFQQRERGALVTWGPYRYVRNPIYLGAFSVVVAQALLAANWLVLLPGLATIAVIYSQIRGEEAMLAERFGEQYLEYMRCTPRIIPRLRRQQRTAGSKDP